MDTSKPTILCVDDEPNVLEGLTLTLRRRFEVLVATSGPAGLALLATKPHIAVLMSDMRMPGMNGAAFLGQARVVAPHVVRLLLTGQAEIDAAISAINEGQIFRFLTKPCPPPALLAAVTAAAEQHRLITAEQVLLEQTLHGAIKALTDVLSIANPVAFGRATRIKTLVTQLVERLGIRERWQVEVAAMLSQLGHITLPSATAERVYFGQPLSPEEQAQVAELPAVTERLLGSIPRLEAVREILISYPKAYRPSTLAVADAKQEIVRTGAHVLRVAVDYDALESRGVAPAEAIDAMMGAPEGRYDPKLLEALRTQRGQSGPQSVRELRPHELELGMVLTEDVKLPTGVLLVPRGFEITPRFLAIIQNLPRGALKDRLRVVVPR